MDLQNCSIQYNENGILSLEVAKLVHKVEKNTRSKAQETIEFKITKAKQNLGFDKR